MSCSNWISCLKKVDYIKVDSKQHYEITTDKIVNWRQKNSLVINTTSTVFMKFSNRRLHGNDTQEIIINNDPILQKISKSDTIEMKERQTWDVRFFCNCEWMHA